MLSGIWAYNLISTPLFKFLVTCFRHNNSILAKFIYCCKYLNESAVNAALYVSRNVIGLARKMSRYVDTQGI